MFAAQSILKSPALVVLVASLAIAGCANKKKLPDNSGQLGFETDSSVLTPTGRSTLDRQAQWLLQYPQHPITVEGHADERGTREYNLALGARRAAAARSYLASKGVPTNRMRTISFGKERPVAVCNDISCWSQNRRSVTLLSAPQG